MTLGHPLAQLVSHPVKKLEPTTAFTTHTHTHTKDNVNVSRPLFYGTTQKKGKNMPYHIQTGLRDAAGRTKSFSFIRNNQANKVLWQLCVCECLCLCLCVFVYVPFWCRVCAAQISQSCSISWPALVSSVYFGQLGAPAANLTKLLLLLLLHARAAFVSIFISISVRLQLPKGIHS